MAYDYDPFEMPIKGMKIPEWVTSTQPPIDAFAQADAVENRDMAIRNQELNALMEATKIQQFNRAREKQDRLDTSLEGFGQWYAKNQEATTPDVYRQMASAMVAGGDPVSAVNVMKAADNYTNQQADDEFAKMRMVATLGNLSPRAGLIAAQKYGMGGLFDDVNDFEDPYRRRRGEGDGQGGGGKDKAFKVETFVSPNGKVHETVDVGSVEGRRKAQELIGLGYRVASDNDISNIGIELSKKGTGGKGGGFTGEQVIELNTGRGILGTAWDWLAGSNKQKPTTPKAPMKDGQLQMFEDPKTGVRVPARWSEKKQDWIPEPKEKRVFPGGN